jgi:uncharacterized protein
MLQTIPINQPDPSMTKFSISLAFATLAIFSATTSHAQSADSKTEWAAKVVALQQGPELDRLVAQLTDSSVQELVANWAPRIEANVPKANQVKATEEMNAELKKYAEDAQKAIGSKVGGVGTSAMVSAYADRFTLDELKQIAGFFDAPAIKKYQTLAPELGNIFVQKLLEASRPDVTARAAKFNEAAAKIVGDTPQAPASGPKSGTGKAPAKK